MQWVIPLREIAFTVSAAGDRLEPALPVANSMHLNDRPNSIDNFWKPLGRWEPSASLKPE